MVGDGKEARAVADTTIILTPVSNCPSMARGREEPCPRCGGAIEPGTPVCPHCGRAVGDGSKASQPVLRPFLFSVVGGWLLIIDAFMAGIFGIVESTGGTDVVIVVVLFGGSIAGLLGSISVFSGWLHPLAMVGPTFLTITHLVSPSFDSDLVAISAFGIFLSAASLFFIVLGWESIKERGARRAKSMDFVVKGPYRP